MTGRPKVVSFYSFKGGAGRTLCTVNVSGLLAKALKASERNPMVLMDMDVDSAGLTILLDQHSAFTEGPWNSSGITTGKLRLSSEPQFNTFLDKMVDISPTLGVARDTVRFMGGSVISRPSMAVGAGVEVMEDFIIQCPTYPICSVVIDSASGLQETAALCHQISDVIVYCLRMSDQFLYGTKSHLKYFVHECVEAGVVPHIILLPLAVPKATLKWQKELYKKRISDLEYLAQDLRSEPSIGKDTVIQVEKRGVCEVAMELRSP